MFPCVADVKCLLLTLEVSLGLLYHRLRNVGLRELKKYFDEKQIFIIGPVISVSKLSASFLIYKDIFRTLLYYFIFSDLLHC